MKTIKQITYYYMFRILVKFDKILERFTKPIDNLKSSGINYTVCTKGNKFFHSCKCGSTSGRCYE
jgi:hypothetical protein